MVLSQNVCEFNYLQLLLMSFLPIPTFFQFWQFWPGLWRPNEATEAKMVLSQNVLEFNYLQLLLMSFL